MSRSIGPGFVSPGALCAISVALARTALADEPAEVEVRGEPIPSPPKDPSVAGSVVTTERMQGPGLQASDVLRTQPGVQVRDTGGFDAPSTASIRGASAAQTPVYLAGIRLNDDVGGAADLSLVPLWLLRSVEIYRSHAPIEADVLGLGGAIFFEPRRPRRTEGGVGTMAGSFGAHANWAFASLAGGGAPGASSVHDPTALVGVRFDGARNDYTFINDGGTRFEPGNYRQVTLTNADVRTIDAWAMGSVHLGSTGRADVVFNDVDRDQGLHGSTYFSTTRARARSQRRLVGLTSHFSCGHPDCEATFSSAAILTQSTFDDPLREAGLGATRLSFHATRVENTASFRWPLGDRLAFAQVVGASIERMAVESSSGAPVHAQRVHSHAAARVGWSATDDWTFFALGSVECHETTSNGVVPWSMTGDITRPVGGATPCGEFQPAARAGVQLGHAPLALFANVGRYARVPTLSELFGISGAVRGNVGLAPETGLAIEAGVRAGASAGVFRGASVDLFGFYRDANDLIAYERASLGYVVPFNVQSARVSGLELLAKYIGAPGLLLEVSATLLDARNASSVRPTNDLLPYEARLVVAPRAEYRAALRAYPIDSAKFSVSYLYESSRYADPAGLVVIPEQGSVDVEASLGALGERLWLRGRLANLLDQTRFDLVGYPLPGRAAYLALEAQWQ